MIKKKIQNNRIESQKSAKSCSRTVDISEFRGILFTLYYVQYSISKANGMLSVIFVVLLTHALEWGAWAGRTHAMTTMLCTIYQTLCNGSIGVHQVCKLGLQSCFLQNKKKTQAFKRHQDCFLNTWQPPLYFPLKTIPHWLLFRGC